MKMFISDYFRAFLVIDTQKHVFPLTTGAVVVMAIVVIIAIKII